jgi:hypothetical protein
MTTRPRIVLISAGPRLLAVTLLWLPFFGALPGWYFTALRWYVFTLMVWWVATQFADNITRGKELWLSVYIVIGLVFNPIMPAHFGRDTWAAVDLLALLAIYVSLFFVPHRLHNVRNLPGLSDGDRRGLPLMTALIAAAVVTVVVQILAATLLGWSDGR